MKYTVLGAGQFYLTPGDVSLYNATGNLVQMGTTTIILDLGRGCLRTLTEVGVSVHDVDAICITHLHPDHIGDVLPFFQAHFIERKLFGRGTKELTIIGPEGIEAFVQQMLAALYDEVTYQPNIVVAPKQCTIGSIQIETAEMQHPIPDIAYKVSAEGKTLVYSGDTGMNENLKLIAHNADVLVLECANDIDQTTENHLNAVEGALVAEAANAKQLIFTHYGHRDRQIHLVQATRGRFGGIVSCAEELMNITL